MKNKLKGYTEMKLKEFEVGMNVYDKHNNIYEVVKISEYANYDVQPVKLRFIKHGENEVDPFWFDPNYVRKDHYNSDWWVCSQYLEHLHKSHFNKSYVEKCVNDILDRIDDLERYNGGNNAYLAKVEVAKFKKEVLEFLKLQNS